MTHGTTTGYKHGCRDACCRRAKRLHETRRRMDRDKGIRYTVPALGTQRRIRALMRLGWTADLIAERAGWTSGNAVGLLLRRKQVNRRTLETVGRVYEELSMQLGPSEITRRRAERSGWAPPLAYDEGFIDDPDYKPVAYINTQRSISRPTREVDPAVVERVLAGEKLRTSKAEKMEILRRWLAQGGSEKALCERMGWKEARYSPRGVAVEVHTDATERRAS